MTEITSDEAAALPGAHPSLEDIKGKIEELFALAPAGGSFLGFYRSVRRTSMSTSESDNTWRIEVRITVPLHPNLLFAQLAAWKVKGSTRTIQFVLRIDHYPDTSPDEESGEDTSVLYTVLNGDYPDSFWRNEEPTPRDFQDPELQIMYGSVYATTKFEDALKVIRSEVSGESAFEA